MTDLDAFVAFYKKLGIEMKPAEDKEGENIIFRFGKDEFGDNDVNDDNRFDGYMGFFSDIEFTKEGEFVRQGFWE